MDSLGREPQDDRSKNPQAAERRQMLSEMRQSVAPLGLTIY